ncbi:MAG: NAD-dependent epimerase/dehydratase family protein [Sphingomonadaceae bacterium]|jgi:nucleoside-diphosphate-sugar epimerase
MKVFVTGGSGFLGRYVIGGLVARGYNVVALARSPDAEAAVRALGAEPCAGDLVAMPNLVDVLRECDAVIHGAALFVMWAPVEEFEKANVEATAHLLREAAAAGIKSFVQIGAGAVVMGDPKDMSGVTEEGTELTFPKWAPYIASKARAEKLVLAANTAAMRTSVVRPPMIWGAGMPTLDHMVANVEAKQFRWPGSGMQKMSTGHAANVAEAAILAIENAPGGKAYFVSDGEDRSLKEVIGALLATRNITPGPASAPLGVARIMARVMEFIWSTFSLRGEPPLTLQMLRLVGSTFTVNDGLARRELKYRPVITWKQGLAAMKS